MAGFLGRFRILVLERLQPIVKKCKLISYER